VKEEAGIIPPKKRGECGGGENEQKKKTSFTRSEDVVEGGTEKWLA